MALHAAAEWLVQKIQGDQPWSLGGLREGKGGQADSSLPGATFPTTDSDFDRSLQGMSRSHHVYSEQDTNKLRDIWKLSAEIVRTEQDEEVLCHAGMQALSCYSPSLHAADCTSVGKLLPTMLPYA
jgi:hypothetical protein